MGSGDSYKSSTSRSTKTNESQPQERPLTLGMTWCCRPDACGGSTEVFKPELSCDFKYVTYESIINDDFIEALGNALRKGGGKRLAEQLLSKYVAAPETS